MSIQKTSVHPLSINLKSQQIRSRRANLASTRDYLKLALDRGISKPPPPNGGLLPALASGKSPQIFAEEVAIILGFAPYQIPILVRMGGLNPLGVPARSPGLGETPRLVRKPETTVRRATPNRSWSRLEAKPGTIRSAKQGEDPANSPSTSSAFGPLFRTVPASPELA